MDFKISWFENESNDFKLAMLFPQNNNILRKRLAALINPLIKLLLSVP